MKRLGQSLVTAGISAALLVPPGIRAMQMQQFERMPRVHPSVPPVKVPDSIRMSVGDDQVLHYPTGMTRLPDERGTLRS
jgi:hypothetical protein